VGVGVQTGSTRHVGHFWPIVSAPGDCEDGEFGGMMNGRGNRSTRYEDGEFGGITIGRGNRST
jgi:hypothetical protein